MVTGEMRPGVISIHTPRVGSDSKDVQIFVIIFGQGV